MTGINFYLLGSFKVCLNGADLTGSLRTRKERNPWVTVIAPVLAAIALAAEVFLLVANWGLQTMDAGGLVPYLPWLLLIAAVIGFAWKRGPKPSWAGEPEPESAADASEMGARR